MSTSRWQYLPSDTDGHRLGRGIGSRHSQIKRRLYDRTGVREYWLVDPELDLVQVFRRADDGRLTRVAELTAEDGHTLSTPLLAGCVIDLRALFRPS